MTATVLIVDDLDANLKLLEAKLVGEYYNVITASSGAIALEILAQSNVDIVLLDVMMPGMDGFETCKSIKSNPATIHIPVIMVTALSDVEDKVKGLEAGADEFLTKPIHDIELFTRIRSLARVKALFDELRLRNNIMANFSNGKIFDFNNNFKDSKILIIDDDVIQAKNIKNQLTSVSPNIELASSAEQLSNLQSGFVADLVIISCQIDVVNPLRLWVDIKSKAQYRNTVLMLLAEEDNMHIVLKGIDLGASDYFIYPIDSSELQARIKTQLRKKYYQDHLRAELENSFDLSTKDHLTGLFNRRYFNIHLEQLMSDAIENKKPFCLVLLDIDHFKKINDNYGHVVGDKVIVSIATRLKSLFRITDLTARYGGEEFVILINNSTLKEGKIIAERVRQEVEHFEFDNNMSRLSVTASIGLVQYITGESVDSIITRADDALYEAKNLGRNRIVFAQ